MSGQRKSVSFWLMTFAHFWKKYKTTTEPHIYQRAKFPQFKTTEITRNGKKKKKKTLNSETNASFWIQFRKADIIYSAMGHICPEENSPLCHLKHWRRYSASAACSKENTWFPTPSWAEWSALGWQSISEFSISLWYGIRPDRKMLESHVSNTISVSSFQLIIWGKGS